MHLQQKILISREEDLSTIVERMVSSAADELFFIIPENSKIFARFSDVQILKEEADNLKKQLAIITPDPRGQAICLELGIPVMDLDRIEITERPPAGEYITEPKKVFDIAPVPSGAEGQQPAVSAPPAEETPFEEEPVEEQPVEEEEKTEEYRYEPYPENHEPQPPVLEESRTYRENIPETEEIPGGEGIRFEERELFEKERKITDFFQKFKPARKVRGFSMRTRILISFVAAAVILFGAALFLVLPKAQVTIETKKEELTFDFSLAAAASANQIDLDKGLIPAQLIQIPKTKTDEFNATGKKVLETKASGKVSIFNAYSSAPQGLVKSTRFLSKEGKLFRLVKSITVPGAMIQDGKIVPRSIDADVVADQTGEDYNIGPTTFTVPGFRGSPKFNGFYAESKSPMSGGAKGEVTVATKDDIESAKTQVFQSLEQVINDEFTQTIPAGLKLIDGAKEVKITDQTVSAAPDTRADKFSVTLQMTASALLFNEDDVRNFVSGTVKAKTPADKEIVWDQEQITYGKAQPDFTKKILKMDVQAKEISRVKLDVNQLKQNLAGKSQQDLQSFLSTMPGLSNSLVKLWPFWTRSVPKNPDKIDIIIK